MRCGISSLRVKLCQLQFQQCYFFKGSTYFFSNLPTAIENDSCHYRTFPPFTSLENIAHRLGSYKSRDENREIQFCLVDRVVSWADSAITGSAIDLLFLTSSSGSDDFRNTHTSGLNCEPTANQIWTDAKHDPCSNGSIGSCLACLCDLLTRINIFLLWENEIISYWIAEMNGEQYFLLCWIATKFSNLANLFALPVFSYNNFVKRRYKTGFELASLERLNHSIQGR